MMSSLLNWLRPRRGTIVNRAAGRKKTLKLYLETLEDRTVPTAIAPPSGMVSWWAGDNSGVDLVGGNNATLSNGAGFDTGKVASGFRFDGVDDNLQAPTVGLPIGSANRTIELWARVDQQQTTGENFFASYGAPGSTNQVYTLGRLIDGRAFVSTWGPGLSGGQIAADGSWHHIAATNVGTSFKLYLDGVNVASGTVAVATPAGSTFWMGRETMSSFGDDRKLNGMVDEVSVYNRALSAAEIQGIYNAGPDGKIKTASNFVTADSPTVGEPPAGSTTTVTFTISRVGDRVGQTTVNWSTADGMATAGTDYIADSGQFVFQDGEAQKTVMITVNGDDLLETPNETFNLVLSTPTPGYTIRGTAQATILEPVSVQGHVYEDLNSNGVFDVGEGLAGWTVFLDGPQTLPSIQPNNVLDPGEPFLLTDANGAYNFTDLHTPIYEVSRILKVGDPVRGPGRWMDTTGSTLRNYLPTSGVVSGIDFGVRYQPFVGVAPAGPETLVNQVTAGQQGTGTITPAATSVSAAPDGHYVIAWRTYVIGGTDTIYAQVFNPDGSPHGDAITVATFHNDSVPNSYMDIEMPKVAMAGNGNFMVEWHYSFLKIYTLDGGLVSGPNPITAGGGVSRIAADANGNYVVLYSGPTKNGLTPIYAQRYTSTGAANGSAIKVASPSLVNGLQGVAMASAGNFVVVWDDITTSHNNGASHVYAQQFTAAGRASGSQITVASGTASADGWTLWPTVAMNASGRFVVTYQYTGAGGQRQARIYNANGTPTTTSPVVLSEPLRGGGMEKTAQVAMDADGNVIFAWTVALNGGYSWEGEARMQRLLASGTLEPVTIVNTTTQGPQFSPGVAATGSGKFVIAWQGYGPTDDAGIYAQRFAPVASYVAPSAPQIGSFTADPNPATAGNPVTFTASNITDPNPGSTITQVAFYQDSNGDGIIDSGDSLLGYGTQSSPGVWTFSFTFSTAGSYNLLAQALDSYGVFSDPFTLNLQVN